MDFGVKYPFKTLTPSVRYHWVHSHVTAKLYQSHKMTVLDHISKTSIYRKHLMAVWSMSKHGVRHTNPSSTLSG